METNLARNFRPFAVLLVPGFLGWIACSAIIGIGMSVTSQSNTLIIHAILAPIVFALLTTLYYKRFHSTTPLQTAVISTSFVISADFLIMASLVIRSYEMFYSVLGTWIPFALIFLSTYSTGVYMTRKTKNVSKKPQTVEEMNSL